MRGAFILSVCGLLAALLVSVVAQQTEPRIRDNRERQALRTVSAVLPPGPFDNEPHADVIGYSDPDLTSGQTLPVYRARRDGGVVATAITVIAPAGYVGPIKLLVGIDRDGDLTGVRALEHRETPGLGDRIDVSQSDWIQQLSGNTPESGWRLKRDGGDVDQITGATITSRATLEAVNLALAYYAENREALSRPAAE